MPSSQLRFYVLISGANEVARELRDVGPDAERAMRDEAFDIAISLADKMKYAARADTPQSGRAASTVRETKAGLWPAITGSNTGRARGVLFGSEFGMNRRSGWYAHPRYSESQGRQFRPHRGQNSYWFYATADREQPWIESEWQGAADEVLRRFRA